MPGKTASWSAENFLKALNLENRYVRVARFYPALIVVALLIPAAVALGIELNGWITAAFAGIGIVFLLAGVVLISHLSAAAGNRLQKRLFPDWPHDSPTNSRLHPSDATSSSQQKQKWYECITRLTDINIATVLSDEQEVRRAINDAIVILRTRVLHENKLAARLDNHNADYGFVRNFAGLRPAWLFSAFASFLICWICYAIRKDNIALPIIASILLCGCLLAAIVIVDYVRQVAWHYADSFFGALDACDHANAAKNSGTARNKKAVATTPSSVNTERDTGQSMEGAD